MSAPLFCPMTQSCGRRAFVAHKAGLDNTLNCSDLVDTKSFAILCEYTAGAINSRPNCISVQRFHHAGCAQILAYGSNRAICLAQSVNNDLRVYKTLSGHKDTVNCVMWIDSFNGPTVTRFNSLLITGSSDGDVKLWDIDYQSHRELISFNISSSVNSVDGCYTNTSETQLVLTAAGQDRITIWNLKLTLENNVTIGADMFGDATSIDLTPHSPLSVRLVCLTGPLVVLFTGLTTGCVDVRIVQPDEASKPIQAGVLTGHSDWLNCLDCQKMFPSGEEMKECTVDGDNVLLATGSQDNQIRVWHIQLLDGKEDPGPNLKGQHLKLPAPQSNTHRLIARLESVLSGHDNWVTGVAWCPVSWTPTTCPQLLSSSRDKSLVIWSPTQPIPISGKASSEGCGDESAPDIWLEQARYGSIGGKSLGFLGCAWGEYNTEVYGHGFWGDLSIWSKESEPRITLTGHYNAVTGLSWCRNLIDNVPLKYRNIEGEDDSSIQTYPPYLLTASRDFTVRLHGLFYTEGSGCNPPVRMWRELARPQVHGYEINDVTSLDAIRYVSAGDEKVERVFMATRRFVDYFFNDATIAEHPSLQGLPIGALRPELGLSNQTVMVADENVDDAFGNPLYPPTEAVLVESTLWPETNKLFGHNYEVYSLAVHPKSFLLASSCKAAKEEFAQIILWRTDTWLIHQKLPFHRLTVTQMRFDSAGTRLLSVSRDRMWALWKANGNSVEDHPIYQLHKHSKPGKSAHSRIIWACAWSPDNRAFLTASRDKHIMAWDSESGESLALPWALAEPITAFDIGTTISNHKGFFAVAGFETGGIELLAISLTDKTCQSLFKMPADWSHMGLSVRRLALHPLDAVWVALASGGDDGFVRIFKISPSSLVDSLTNA